MKIKPKISRFGILLVAHSALEQDYPRKGQ